MHLKSPSDWGDRSQPNYGEGNLLTLLGPHSATAHRALLPNHRIPENQSLGVLSPMGKRLPKSCFSETWACISIATGLSEQSARPTHRLPVHRSRVEPRKCICNKFSGNADAAGPGTTLPDLIHPPPGSGYIYTADRCIHLHALRIPPLLSLKLITFLSPPALPNPSPFVCHYRSCFQIVFPPVSLLAYRQGLATLLLPHALGPTSRHSPGRFHLSQ